MKSKYRLKRIKDYIQYDIPAGVENLIKWLPIIWKNRDWDYCFIYIILRHKLHLMEQLIRHHGMHVHNIRDADGYTAPQIVIKLVECNGKPVAKISDDPAKTMCEDINYIKYLHYLIEQIKENIC